MSLMLLCFLETEAKPAVVTTYDESDKERQETTSAIPIRLGKNWDMEQGAPRAPVVPDPFHQQKYAKSCRIKSLTSTIHTQRRYNHTSPWTSTMPPQSPYAPPRCLHYRPRLHPMGSKSSLRSASYSPTVSSASHPVTWASSRRRRGTLCSHNSRSTHRSSPLSTMRTVDRPDLPITPDPQRARGDSSSGSEGSAQRPRQTTGGETMDKTRESSRAPSWEEGSDDERDGRATEPVSIV